MQKSSESLVGLGKTMFSGNELHGFREKTADFSRSELGFACAKEQDAIFNLKEFHQLEGEIEQMSDVREKEARKNLLAQIMERITDYDVHIREYAYQQSVQALIDRGLILEPVEREPVVTEWVTLALQYGKLKDDDWKYGKIITGDVTPQFIEMLVSFPKPDDTEIYNKMPPFFQVFLDDFFQSCHYGTEIYYK